MSTFKKGDRVVFVNDENATGWKYFKKGDVLVVDKIIYYDEGNQVGLLFEGFPFLYYPSTWFVSEEEYEFNNLIEQLKK